MPFSVPRRCDAPCWPRVQIIHSFILRFAHRGAADPDAEGAVLQSFCCLYSDAPLPYGEGYFGTGIGPPPGRAVEIRRT